MPDATARVVLDLSPDHADVTRRRFMATFSGLGLGGTLFPGALWARAQEAPEVTAAMVQEAEKVAGLEFSAEERELMLEGLQRNLSAYEALREVRIPNEVPPAVHFEPHLPAWPLPDGPSRVRFSRPTGVQRPARLEDVAFWSIGELGELIRTRQVSCVELTRMYLGRLEQHAPTLECTVSLTAERALAQAERLDAELAQGRYRGPLHGIPWGGKDLLSVRGTRTT